MANGSDYILSQVNLMTLATVSHEDSVHWWWWEAIFWCAFSRDVFARGVFRSVFCYSWISVWDMYLLVLSMCRFSYICGDQERESLPSALATLRDSPQVDRFDKVKNCAIYGWVPRYLVGELTSLHPRQGREMPSLVKTCCTLTTLTNFCEQMSWQNVNLRLNCVVIWWLMRSADLTTLVF